MPICECDNYGAKYIWSWEEAFDKFGFNDGDGQVETWAVEAVLTKARYEVEVNQWGLHNTIIVSIKKAGKELLPHHNLDFTLGYDDPKEFLPLEIVQLLNKELGGNDE